MVSRSGALLERSIVDRMVGGPERLVFEGGPVLVPPLQQDKASRRPIAVAGVVLDTLAACPPLTIVEQARLDELKARERERLAPERAKARAAFIERQARKLVARTGMSEKAARDRSSSGNAKACCGRMSSCRSTTRSWPDAPSATCWRTRSVSRARRWPTRWKASSTGVARRRSCAGTTARRGSTAFAHGRTIYELKHDAASRAQGDGAAAKEDVVATFARLAAGADLDAVELDGVAAAGQANLRRRPARDQRRAEGGAAAARRAAAPGPRAAHAVPRLPAGSAAADPGAIPADARGCRRWTVLNEVIGAMVRRTMPPVRNIDDDATRVRKLPVPQHARIHQSPTNAPEGDDQ